MREKKHGIRRMAAVYTAAAALFVSAALFPVYAEDYEWQEEEVWQETEEAARDSGSDTDAVKSHLAGLPDSRGALADEGVVETSDGSLVNSGRWYSFLENVQSGVPASVDVATFNVHGEAVIDHVDFDGYSFVCVRDNTRNHHYLGSSYIVRTYSYLTGYGGDGLTAIYGSGEAEGGTEGWKAAVLVRSPYDSLDGVREAIENDVEGISPPAILFDLTGSSDEETWYEYGEPEEYDG